MAGLGAGWEWLEIHPSANRHGVANADIAHAVRNAVVAVPIDPEADRPKELLIGPDRSGRLLEVICIHRSANRSTLIHAMPLRRTFIGHLPQTRARGL